MQIPRRFIAPAILVIVLVLTVALIVPRHGEPVTSTSPGKVALTAAPPPEALGVPGMPPLPEFQETNDTGADDARVPLNRHIGNVPRRTFLTRGISVDEIAQDPWFNPNGIYPSVALRKEISEFLSSMQDAERVVGRIFEDEVTAALDALDSTGEYEITNHELPAPSPGSRARTYSLGGDGMQVTTVDARGQRSYSLSKEAYGRVFAVLEARRGISDRMYYRTRDLFLANSQGAPK